MADFISTMNQITMSKKNTPSHAFAAFNLFIIVVDLFELLIIVCQLRHISCCRTILFIPFVFIWRLVALFLLLTDLIFSFSKVKRSSGQS